MPDVFEKQEASESKEKNKKRKNKEKNGSQIM